LSDLRITHLDHGLRVVTEQVPGALSVAAGAWVGVGARDESPALSGASHFLEHLLFKGTATRSAHDISRTIDRCGGDINAFTNKEYTAFVTRVPQRHAEVGLDLLGDILTAPALRAADIEVERQVILEEIAMDDDSPDDVAHRMFAEQLFVDHPLGRETAGTRESVLGISGDDVREFFARHYRAGSMVVSVAGPRSHDEMLALVAAGFAGLSSGDGRADRTPPAGTGTNQALVDDTEQVHLVLGGRGLARDDTDREALDVVNHILGGGLSSRLFDVIREQRGLAYSVYSGTSCYGDAGAWVVGAGTLPDNADEVLSLIIEQLELLRAHGLTDDEIDVAKGALTGTFELGLEDTGSRMTRNGALLCVRGEIVPVDEQVRRWLGVDQAATRRAIERVYTADPIVVTLGPG
jgi:predicted Zn-dependent peptidase